MFVLKSMPQSLGQVYLHIVFSTMDRRPFLEDDVMRERTHRYMAGICKKCHCPALRINGPEDHVHILSRFTRTTRIADLVRETKRASSLWIHDEMQLKEFKWQCGYGAFSVGASEVDRIIRYIDRQLEHHAKFSYKDEYRKLCQEYGIQIDERYAWD